MIMRSPKNRFEQFIRNKIYLKDDTNCMIGIVDFYDGSNDYKIHKYVMAITDKIPETVQDIFKVEFYSFDETNSKPFILTDTDYYKIELQSFYTSFSSSGSNSFTINYNTIINNKIKVIPLKFELKNFVKLSEFKKSFDNSDFSIDSFSYSIANYIYYI